MAENGDFVELIIKNDCDKETYENIDKLTERFYRVDASRTEEDSYGLGLNICIAIMDKQKGYLKVEADENSQRIVARIGFEKS